MEAIDGFRQHQGERVLARAARACEDQRMRKAVRADTLAEMVDGLRVAEELLKAHGSSLVHVRVAGQNWIMRPPGQTHRNLLVYERKHRAKY